jgi:putative phosphotransacetylase
MTTTIDNSDMKMIAQVIVEKIFKEDNNDHSEKMKKDLLNIPIGVSNRHVHLCQKDMDILFGEGSELTIYRELSQKGYFAAKETVTLAGPKGALNKVRLLGPLRNNTQIELLASDRFALGIEPPVRESGTQALAPTITLVGPKGTVINHMGGMVAWRHIHMNAQEAKLLDLNDGDYIKVKTQGEREIIFSNVKVRIGEAFRTELHLDSDEANAAGIKNGENVKIIL